MNTLDLRFGNNEIEIHRKGQKGIEIAPELVEYLPALMNLINLQANKPTAMHFDFEKNAVSLDYTIPENLSESVYAAINYGNVDLSNVTKLFETVINGQLPQSFLDRALEVEAQQNEADPALKAFLALLNPNDPPTV